MILPQVADGEQGPSTEKRRAPDDADGPGPKRIRIDEVEGSEDDEGEDFLELERVSLHES